MTSKQFFKYLAEPEQLNDGSVVELEQLIKQFPFFQTAHLLYLKALNRINPKLVAEKLPKESLFVSDRTVLHTILRKPAPEVSSSKAAPAADAPSPKQEQKADAPKPADDKKTSTSDTPNAAPATADKKADNKPTATAGTESVVTKKTTTITTETKTEPKQPLVEVKEIKETTTTNDKPAGDKKALTNEERKQNHDNLVKDFFDLKDKENYETVATNVAEDGSIKSAAAELAAKSQIDRGTVINEKTSAPQQVSTTKTTVTTTVIEQTTKPAENKPKEDKQKEEKTKEDKPQEDNKDEILDKIATLRKEREEANKKRAIAEEEAKKSKAAAEAEAKRVAEEAAAKAKAEAEAAKAKAEAAAKAKAEAEAAAKAKAEAEAAAKAKAEAEAEAKAKAEAEAEAEAAAKAKAEAEAAAAKAEAEAAEKAKAAAEEEAKRAAAEAKKAADNAQTVTTTVTTTTVTETVTTTVEPAQTAEPEKTAEPAKPAEEEQGMSAADKLLARLNKYKASEPAPVKSGTNLIDKFLQEDPHLDRNKEIPEGDMGQESVKQPELYSEKLAKLYIQQGHYDKAIASYEKLNSKYPERAAYFAAQILEIQKLMNNKQ